MRKTQMITNTALLIAVGVMLPFLTAQLQELGNLLTPMHFPVFVWNQQYTIYLIYFSKCCYYQINSWYSSAVAASATSCEGDGTSDQKENHMTILAIGVACVDLSFQIQEPLEEKRLSYM